MKARAASPDALVDLNGLEELKGVSATPDGGLEIGAMTTYSQLIASEATRARPIVAEVCAQIADVQVRNRGTIGGSLAHGDPVSDMPAVLLALDGEVDVTGPGGTRTIAARDFFVDVFQTALGPQELVTEVRVPKLTGEHVWSFQKYRRRAQDWATVGVAAVARHGNGSVADAAIALVSMGATPLRATAAEAAWNAGEDPGAAAAEGTEPPSDTFASAEFRRHLAQVLVRRATAEATAGGPS